tara:strand:+ start:276 stop:1070 length:795 start_codon:yes stop_codon:yes gene_type:complete
MKKILAVICFSFLSLNFANAEILSVGISGNIGLLEADGKETITGTSQRDITYGNNNTRLRADGVSSTSTTKGAEDVFIGYVSLFGEAHIFNSGVRVGVSYVPYALESETTDNTRNDNCSRDYSDGKTGNNTCTPTKQQVQIDVEDLVTMYVAYHHDVDAFPLGLIDSVFVKGGIIEADVITKEKLASGAEYGNATLSGQFVGLGVEKNMDNGLFVRFEGNVTAYQDIQLKNQKSESNATDGNKNTIDITGLDGATATLSIGKSF